MAGSYSSLRAEKLTPSKKQAEHALTSNAEAQKVSPHNLREDVGADPLLKEERAYLRRLAGAFLAVAFWAG